MKDYDQLKLGNQLCFPLYAASRLVTRLYQPHLEKLGITYPQYLVLMVLWENNILSVSEIAKKLILNTNTLTPLLKRLEKLGFLKRNRSKEDERKVIVELSEKGKELKEEAVNIPTCLLENFADSDFREEDFQEMKNQINGLIDYLKSLNL